MAILRRSDASLTKGGGNRSLLHGAPLVMIANLNAASVRSFDKRGCHKIVELNHDFISGRVLAFRALTTSHPRGTRIVGSANSHTGWSPKGGQPTAR